MGLGLVVVIIAGIIMAAPHAGADYGTCGPARSVSAPAISAIASR